MAESTFGPFIADKKAVTAAGTAERLRAVASDGRGYKSIVIKAEPSNTGVIYVGGKGVASTTNGGLAAGDVLRLSSDKAFPLSEIWINSSVSSDGVDFWGAY